LKLAWALFVREWRAGELRLAGLALMLAVAAVSGVGLTQNRVAAALLAGAARLTAGDLVLSTDHLPDPAWARAAQSRGLAVSLSASFSSMLRGPEHSVLVSVKAVAPNFPLRGALRLQGPGGSGAVPAAAPAPGQAYLAPGLAARLGLAPGASLALGHASLRLAGVIADEPDAGLSAFRIAPRVLIAADDLDATGLVRAGSRVSWRLAVAGPPDRLLAWRTWGEPRLVAGEHIEAPVDSRPEVRALIDQAGQFLQLSALATVLLAAVALLFALRRHVERQRDAVAILRCLGASRRQVLALQAWCLVYLGGLAALAGLGLGGVLQALLAAVVGPLVGVPLPLPGLAPLLQGLAVAGLLLAGFALPGLLALLRVPALQVLRSAAGSDTGPTGDGWSAWLFGVSAVAAVALLGAARPAIALAALGALLAVGAAAAGCARGVLWLSEAVSAALPLLWRQGLRGLRRRPGFASLQAGALAVGLMVLLVLGLVRNDLIRTWQSSLPVNAPNHFIIGIQPDERAPLAKFMQALGRAPLDLRPLVRARLTRIDDRPVTLEGVRDPRARALLDREFNLTWAAQPNADNRITAGRWWDGAPSDAGLSLEQGFADRLHLQVGSRLRFDIAGVNFESRVASLRQVRWDSFQPNFFVIARPGLLDAAEASYIASFRVEPGDQHTVDALAASFPQVSLIDTGALIAEVRELTGQVALAVQMVFGFSVLAGMIVLLAGIRATHDERLREGALLRALGATARQLRTLQWVEFGLLGLAAGLAAALGALLASWVVTTWLLELAWQPDLRIPLLGTVSGLAIVGFTAALALRPLARAVPAESLRLFQ
jgi:putative ABC transport system permease protein